MSDHLAATRASYDAAAENYTEFVSGKLEGLPMMRAVLGAFAELVDGPVAEVGCGPGNITSHLASLGVEIRGIDLAPRMVEIARAAYPGLRFDVGSMTSLKLADGELGGLVAWYSIHHLPPGELPGVLAGFHRVLSSGGRLLIGTHAGDEERRLLTEAYGVPVRYESFIQPPERIVESIRSAGFTITAQLLEPGIRPGRSYLSVFAQKD
ncbi:class I SAM-dependent DNA methyltransferase [Kribbella sp. CA-293567]|uniref:class I SAM-dependent DNA methyltransferase n=1 Tax=Kribbella sp. CA-293567 TaxID=3002436 RepID=UPI0022DDCEF3|nr:class I SAM-dependent methyltransferase [Kribbella sp. CA-293567]WBQ02100.1 class I SAM-dependent methyltransferase [Kribbella sp. CA-293567]